MIPIFVSVIRHDFLQLKNKGLFLLCAVPQPGRIVSAHHSEGSQGSFFVGCADAIQLARGADVGDSEHGLLSVCCCDGMNCTGIFGSCNLGQTLVSKKQQGIWGDKIPEHA